MNFIQPTLNTIITQLPKVISDNNTLLKNYLDIFYDEINGIIIKPISTTGKVKAGSGEFVNMIVDNLTVKNQYTNLYSNTTTADLDYVNTYNDASNAIYREAHDVSLWPVESILYKWIDVNKPYYKIGNDVSIAFTTTNISQEIHVIFKTTSTSTSLYTVLLEASSGYKKATVTNANAPKTWMKLIAYAYDASYGPKWAIKEYGGTYT